jgi:hypothetical protein
MVGSILLLLPQAVYADAQQTTNKGLFITPARAFAKVDPGSSTHGSITVGNYTNHPLIITLSVGQFTVADYTYDYRFSAPHDDWVKLSLTQIALDPGKSQNVTYTATPPPATTPGGHYFAVFASAAVSDNSTKNEVRATTVLYVTVNGALHITSEIKNVSIPQLVFGDITYSLDVKDTGNTHFFIYTTGGLNGLPEQKNANNAHLLLPQAVRQVSGKISAPLLPGIYAATYGYITESGQKVQRVSHILYIPWWTLSVVSGVIWIAMVLWRRSKRRHRKIFRDSLPPQYK